jgi:pyruvate dehydrogenase E2 component (dihydrolipoamide acetyltransferase)
MARPVVMPKLGQSEEEGKIVRWLKREGERVAKGDILFEIETDKALLEVESFFDGTLLKIAVTEGLTVPIGSVVGFLGDPGEAIPEDAASAQAPPETETTLAPEESLRLTEQSGSPLAESARPESFKISPRAAKLARERGIDPASIIGTGPGGRIVERDVVGTLESKEGSRFRPERPGDTEAATDERPKPMTRMRRVIAKRLTQSYLSTPHFFVTVSADVTELESLRSELKAQGVSYSITDFILKAAAHTLEQFPTVNSTTDGESITTHSRIHLGLAVALEEGLVVPVIRDANHLMLAELHDRATDLTAKARAGKLPPEEMTGSTFTISNMGMLDVENFTAIINPGESAILAVSSMTRQPVARDDQVVIRSLMKMTLSSDHRIIDGALAARFLNAIRKILEDTSFWRQML